MNILSIVGHGNGGGKTELLCSIARARPGVFSAVKFTTIFKGGSNCPRDAQLKCACSKLKGDFEIIEDAEILGMPNTDTGRMLQAGLDPVYWCLARPETHAQAWPNVQARLPETNPLLTEGNSATSILPVTRSLFIVNPASPMEHWKSDWQELARKADAIVVNDCPEALGGRSPAGAEDKRGALDALQALTPETPRIVARLDEAFRAWAGPYLEELIDSV